MRVVFMGTPKIAASCLEGIIKAGHEIVGVFTQPDKPRGRGHKLCFSEVKEVAVRENIPVFQPEKLRGNEEMLELLKSLNADVGVVVAYGQILPQAFLDAPKHGCINTHASLLPKLRGAAPIQRAIINGDDKTGVTIMQMAAGLDTGDILLKLEMAIDDSITAAELFEKMEQPCIEGILETLNLIEQGKLAPIVQDESLATWASPLTKEEGKIDFSKNSKEIVRLIHGLNSWPIAYTNIAGIKTKVLTAKISDLKGEIGELLHKSKLIIGTGDGSVELIEVVPEGKKKMEGSALINGQRLSKNTIIISE